MDAEDATDATPAMDSDPAPAASAAPPPVPVPEDRLADLAAAIRVVEAAAANPAGGRRPDLPLEVFLLVSRLAPVFCVDLWIEDARGRVLLTWRDDAYFGRGWHIPGGAVRFQETIEARLRACAREELGAEVAAEPVPMAVVEEIEPAARARGHNVAAAYRCTLVAGPDPARAYRGGAPRPGQWAWHAGCPPDLLPVHRVYAPYFPRRPRPPRNPVPGAVDGAPTAPPSSR